MEFDYGILDNVRLVERFMIMFQMRITGLPDILLLDYHDVHRYVYEFVDDSISQYASWCATTNKASDLEEELRSKVMIIGHAYGVDMTPYLDNWFEGLDKEVLSILEENIRQIHYTQSSNTVFKLTMISDSSLLIENMGPAT